MAEETRATGRAPVMLVPRGFADLKRPPSGAGSRGGGEMSETTATIPKWHVVGDWFDTCKCNVPCPCSFAQPPTFGDCDGVLVWHIREVATAT